MNPKQFLLIGGLVLLILSALGWLGVNIQGFLYLDRVENISHAVLGILALLGAFAISVQLQRWLTIVYGISTAFFGIAGLLVAGSPEPNFLGITNFNWADNISHFIFAIWAFWVTFTMPERPLEGVPS